MAKKRYCRISYPALQDFEHALELHRTRYPTDRIELNEGGKEQAE